MARSETNKVTLLRLLTETENKVDNDLTEDEEDGNDFCAGVENATAAFRREMIKRLTEELLL